MELKPTAPAMPSRWKQIFHAAFGPRNVGVGQDSGGDAGGPTVLGPEYGGRLADGRFAVLDSGYNRLAVHRLWEIAPGSPAQLSPDAFTGRVVFRLVDKTGITAFEA